MIKTIWKAGRAALALGVLLGAGLATGFQDPAVARGAGNSYLIGNMPFFVYQTQQPGFIGVHVGINRPAGASDHSVLVHTFGDIPPYYAFRDAAEMYLRGQRGRCRITGHERLWLGEVVFSYFCR